MWIVIPAGGTGDRFSQERPKQYWTLAGKTILEYTCSLFLTQSWVTKIVVAIADSDCYFEQLSTLKHPKIARVSGGVTRAHSVRNALQSIQQVTDAADWVLVHDAVRPCLDKRDLQSLLQLRDDPVGGILASKVTDTIKKVNHAMQITETVDRQMLWQAQTPQMFRLGLLFDALVKAEQAGENVTDEAWAIQLMGYTARIIPAHYPNPKLTYPADLTYISSLLEEKMTEVA
ncbi:MAG: 2-C-methyl-D-erythritol 4-phosphate cytidylyltransferase [Candidatus Berkiella sp.]